MNDVSEHARFRLKAVAYILPLVASKFRQKMKKDPEFASRVAKAGGLDVVSRHDAEMHIGSMHDSIFGQLPGPFIISFCRHQPTSYEAKNGLLSMWRGYGSAGGIAIVLAEPGIRDLLKEERSAFAHSINRIGNVRYDHEDRGIRLDYRAFFDKTPSIIKDFYNRVPPRYEKVFDSFVQATTLVKHRAFHEEREVRVVICPRTTDPNSVFYDRAFADKLEKAVKYRRRGEGEARYIELFGRSSLPIRRIIIGPSRIQKVHRQRLESLLAGTDVLIEMSEIPFVG